jgi:hypothetical protein
MYNNSSNSASTPPQQHVQGVHFREHSNSTSPIFWEDLENEGEVFWIPNVPKKIPLIDLTEGANSIPQAPKKVPDAPKKPGKRPLKLPFVEDYVARLQREHDEEVSQQLYLRMDHLQQEYEEYAQYHAEGAAEFKRFKEAAKKRGAKLNKAHRAARSKRFGKDVFLLEAMHKGNTDWEEIEAQEQALIEENIFEI